MGEKKKFVEKVYFKVVTDVIKKKVVNGNVTVITTIPETRSVIFTTKETGHKFLKEKLDTTVTNILYKTIQNSSVIGSPFIANYQTNINEKDSFVCYIGTEIIPGETILPGEFVSHSVVTGANGRFEGATEVKTIIKTNVNGNIKTDTHNVTVTGYR